MYIVALTGGIGSGKSTVANLFAELGVELVDADIVAREVVAPGSPALGAIAAHFGPAIITADGTLDCRALRERVFANPDEKAWLNGLLHPVIREEMVRQCAATRSPYCLLVVPLLVENGLTGLGQRVLVVDVDEQTQIARTCQRDGVTPEAAGAIVAAQASRAERLAKAQDVILNQDKSLETLRAEILVLHQRYLGFASQQARPQ